MTLTDFAIRVLRKMQVLPAGETVEADDSELILDIYEDVREQLYAEEIINWSATDAVPDWAVLPMIYLVASHAVDDFHVEPNLKMALQARYAQAKGQLVKLTAPQYMSQPTEFPNY